MEISEQIGSATHKATNDCMISASLIIPVLNKLDNLNIVLELSHQVDCDIDFWLITSIQTCGFILQESIMIPLINFFTKH